MTTQLILSLLWLKGVSQRPREPYCTYNAMISTAHAKIEICLYVRGGRFTGRQQATQTPLRVGPKPPEGAPARLSVITHPLCIFHRPVLLLFTQSPTSSRLLSFIERSVTALAQPRKVPHCSENFGSEHRGE